MFGIFKRKTEKEKLLLLYKKIKSEAYRLSKIDRRQSDEKEKEASDILDAIDKIEEFQDNEKN
tara:strand:- start:5204 stop:5392 length:189 start_codon:yes stop_codon:yes gene_type:complete